MKRQAELAFWMVLAVLDTLIALPVYANGQSAPVDTAALVVTPSPPAASVTLTGILHVGYMKYSTPIFVHDETERRQRYMFLHLGKPIDVLATTSNKHYRVAHQYDIQVVGPVSYSFISHCVTIVGKMPSAGGIVGGPDWQPFPLTISVQTIHAAHMDAKHCSIE